MVKRIAWYLVVVGSVLGSFQFLAGIAEAKTVTHQIAAAAMGCAWVVIPYCFARAVSEI
ncbi:MAG: hypothetical protein RBS96_02225 [Dehalococcoidales bacterium]|jgi:hypothetical protein|nr:hypothetical protein [Dehalococcoidales bacterium]